jgi:hypothetical protein
LSLVPQPQSPGYVQGATGAALIERFGHGDVEDRCGDCACPLGCRCLPADGCRLDLRYRRRASVARPARRSDAVGDACSGQGIGIHPVSAVHTLLAPRFLARRTGLLLLCSPPLPFRYPTRTRGVGLQAGPVAWRGRTARPCVSPRMGVIVNQDRVAGRRLRATITSSGLSTRRYAPSQIETMATRWKRGETCVGASQTAPTRPEGSWSTNPGGGLSGCPTFAAKTMTGGRYRTYYPGDDRPECASSTSL